RLYRGGGVALMQQHDSRIEIAPLGGRGRHPGRTALRSLAVAPRSRGVRSAVALLLDLTQALCRLGVVWIGAERLQVKRDGAFRLALAARLLRFLHMLGGSL